MHRILLLCSLLGCDDATNHENTTSYAPTSSVDGIEDRLQEIAAPYVDLDGVAGKAVGLVVGVSVVGERHVVGLGATERGGDQAPDADAIFEIGSVTKVFTGFLLARAMNDGDLVLEQPIDPWFPDGTPHWDMSVPVTLLDLATHTASLPDFPPNLHSTDPANPGAGYTDDDLAAFLAQFELPFAPGIRFSYSNLGAGILGEVEVLEAGAADYEALVGDRVSRPLGLTDTQVQLAADQEPRRVIGYSAGVEAPQNEIGEPLAGGGALRSTADDLLTFLDAGLGVGPPEAVAAWDQVLTPRRPSGLGVEGQTGLLMNLEDWDGVELWSKNGGTAGFQSQVFLVREPAVTVVLLANANDIEGMRTLGEAVLGEVLP